MRAGCGLCPESRRERRSARRSGPPSSAKRRPRAAWSAAGAAQPAERPLAHQVSGAFHRGLRRVTWLLSHPVPAEAAIARIDQDAAQVRDRVIRPPDPPPGHVRPGQGDLNDVLGGPSVSGQAEGQPDQPGPPRYREGAEVLAAAADNVRGGAELVERSDATGSTPLKSTVAQRNVARPNADFYATGSGHDAGENASGCPPTAQATSMTSPGEAPQDLSWGSA